MSHPISEVRADGGESPPPAASGGSSHDGDADSTQHRTPFSRVVDALRSHPDIRVLRRFVPRRRYNDLSPLADLSAIRIALYVDAETTGLDATTDRITELALVPFEFDADGNVYNVYEGVSWLNDPGIPIPPEVTALTGITDAMVRGQAIDTARVAEELNIANLVIAHHADFDRKVLERTLPAFADVAWACSHREVPWRDRFGCACAKLEHVLADTCQEFFEAHRALDDCRVGVHVLAAANDMGRPALSFLLDSSNTPTVRVWADRSPFAMKDELKLTRGYRWHDGETGPRKNWYRDCTPAEADAEVIWLSQHGVTAIVQQFGARDRYSVRVA